MIHATTPIETLAPYVLQNDCDRIHHDLNSVLTQSQELIQDNQENMAAALWHSSTGMSMALRILPEQIIQHLDKMPEIELYSATASITQQGVVLRIDHAEIESKVTPIASIIAADGTVRAIGIVSQATPNLAPGTVIIADLQPTLDEKMRLEISSSTELTTIGLIPDDSFPQREIPTTAGQFRFERVSGKIKAYLQHDQTSLLLGHVDDSSTRKIADISAITTGTYRRGTYAGNNGIKLTISVRSIVEHQPVARELIQASRNPDKSLIILSVPEKSVISAELAKVLQQPENNLYQPTRAELLKWYQAAQDIGNLSLKEVLLSLGRQLSAEYKSTGQGGIPPLNYCSYHISISSEFRLEMESLEQQQINFLEKEENETIQIPIPDRDSVDLSLGV